MGLRKFKDIIKSIGAPNKDDTLLGVFNGKTAQKSIEDILKVADYTALQNRPITILSQDFKVSDLKESSLYFVNSDINCKKEDGSLLVSLYAGILILTGTGGEAQVFDSYNTYYVQDLSTGDWFNDDCNHITTQETKDMLSDLGIYSISYTSPSTKKTTTPPWAIIATRLNCARSSPISAFTAFVTSRVPVTGGCPSGNKS